MQKQFPLKTYIKAAEILAKNKGFDRLEYWDKKGSIVRFDLFMPNEHTPCKMWQVHTEHTKRREVSSKEDFRKAANNMNTTLEEFWEILKSI